MLVEKWLEVVRERADTVLLRQGGVEWSARDIERRSLEVVVSDVDFLVAYGDEVDFVPVLLAGWRCGVPVMIKETRSHEVREIGCAIPVGTVLIKQACGASGVERSLFYDEAAVFAEGMRNVFGLGLTRDRVGLAAVSLSHTYGFGCLTLPLILEGIAVEVLEAPLPMFVQGALELGGDYFLPGVPALWKTWLLTGVLKVGGIGLAVSAGSPLSGELEGKIFEECGVLVRNFYGTSETGAVAFYDGDGVRGDEGVLGSVLGGVDVQVEAGRVFVRTDARASGADVLLGAGEFEGDFYEVMDLGWVEDGVLIWEDFVGEAINVAGRKVSPEKVARVIGGVDGVVSVMVGKRRSRDLERFEEVVVDVVLADGVEVRAVKGAVYGVLDNWEMPRKWIVV